MAAQKQNKTKKQKSTGCFLVSGFSSNHANVFSMILTDHQIRVLPALSTNKMLLWIYQQEPMRQRCCHSPNNSTDFTHQNQSSREKCYSNCENSCMMSSEALVKSVKITDDVLTIISMMLTGFLAWVWTLQLFNMKPEVSSIKKNTTIY